MGAFNLSTLDRADDTVILELANMADCYYDEPITEQLVKKVTEKVYESLRCNNLTILNIYCVKQVLAYRYFKFNEDRVQERG